MKVIRKKMALLLTLGATAGAWLPLQAATDYFVVGAKGGSSTPATLHIFSYDSDTAQLTFHLTITNTHTCNMNMGLSALPGYGFVQGHRYAPHVERWVTTDKVTWTSDLKIDISKTTAGAFLDSGFRASSLDVYACGVAMLKDGKIFITNDRSQTDAKRYYGLGDVGGLSGTVTAIFPRDTNHLGELANNVGAEQRLRDVVGTIEGTANRFVTCSQPGGSDALVMVYEADGTYKGPITPTGTGSRGLGVFKQPGLGDVVLQANTGTDYPATISIRGICVDDARFDTALFSFAKRFESSGNFYINVGDGYIDIDGLESGRIIVLGEVRRGGQSSGYFRGVVVFRSDDGGTTWVNETTQVLILEDAIGAPAGVTGQTLAGLYAGASAQNGTVILFK